MRFKGQVSQSEVLSALFSHLDGFHDVDAFRAWFQSLLIDFLLTPSTRLVAGEYAVEGLNLLAVERKEERGHA